MSKIEHTTIHDRVKEEHAKNAIFVWYGYGVIALLFKNMHGVVPFLVYFIVGIFIASVASIVTFLVRPVLSKFVSRSIQITLFFFMDIVWVVFVGYFFLNAVNSVFGA